jgi:DNA-binding MarR family transcriptional regulator
MDDHLKLENQLCFALYTSARTIVRKYKPFLDPLGLTYTQYIALLVLWEQDGISIKDLGEHLMLDSGTLTPLVKKLEKQGLLKRERGQSDERYVSIVLTEEGRALKLKASDVPFQIAKHLHLDEAEGYALKQRLDQFILDNKHLD